MTVAIRIESISKQYRLGEIGTGSLAHDVNRWWHRIRGKEDPYLRIGEANDRSKKGESEYVWALRDVSFDIQQGEVVGIIGRNGAGKSTLLKILSRVTSPTTGTIKTRGRIASLLEVGTGFHPELTGRENIYLNGAILGMRKYEITRKLDEIIEFSGCERYIDTPVKRYSSGMYVRLAFAVAAHLSCEILVVDEVLAVGDAEFQEKCLGKLRQVSAGGRTVLFVSHNIAAIRQLCKKTAYLKEGCFKTLGPTTEVLDEYITSNRPSCDSFMKFPRIAPNPQFDSISLLNPAIKHRESLIVRVALFSDYEVDAGIEFEIRDRNGMAIAYTSTSPMAGSLLRLCPGMISSFDIQLGPLRLARGHYDLYLWLIKPWQCDFHRVELPLRFTVTQSDPYNTGFDFQLAYGRGALAVPIRVITMEEHRGYS